MASEVPVSYDFAVTWRRDRGLRARAWAWLAICGALWLSATPAHAEPPTTQPESGAEATVADADAADAPVPDTGDDDDALAEALHTRAEQVRALVDGTLDPTVDALMLFVVDLGQPHRSGTDGAPWLRWLGEVDTTQAKGRAPKPKRLPSDATALQRASAAIDHAYLSFFALSPKRRRQLLDDHRGKYEAGQAAQQQAARSAARGRALDEQADRLEAFLAGTLDLSVDPASLVRIDLLGPDELTSNPQRRKRLLEGGETPTEIDPDDVVARAQQRLDQARLTFTRLPPDQRAERFSRHQARQAEAASQSAAEAAAETPPSDEEDPVEIIDPEQNHNAELIDSAENAAARAGQEKRQALADAENAKSEAMRVVEKERARLLGIKEAQANYDALLRRRKQDAQKVHERALEWHRKVGELEASRAFASERAARADPMYRELRETLATARAALDLMLKEVASPRVNIPTASPPPDQEIASDVDREDLNALRAELAAGAEDLERLELELGWQVANALRDDVVALNRDRLRLLDLASESLHSKMTGFGPEGVDQARREFDQIALELRYHARSLPRHLANAVDEIRAAPVDMIVTLVELLVVLALFRWWRARADELLRRLRAGRRADGDVPPLRRVLDRALWYLRRIRKPLEWLALVAIFVQLSGQWGREPEVRLLWIILVWSLSGWAGILLLDAIAARQSLYTLVHTETAKLRFLSLEVVGITVVLVGMLLNLTAEMVGRGAIYNWVFQTCWVLVVPIVLWLIRRWRPTIFDRIGSRAAPNAVLRWVSANREGISSFPAALVGGATLLGSGLLRWGMRQLSGLDSTRRLLAYLFRREVAKQAKTDDVRKYEPADESVYDAFDPEGDPKPTVEDYARDEIASALELTRVHTTTLTAIVGERGAGKTTFLNRLVAQSDDTTCIVGCPPQGFDALVGALAQEFEAADKTPTAVATAIRSAGPSIICVDDAQRMIEPAIGGLADLDRFTRFALQVGGDVSWVVAVQAASWHYVQRARGERVFFDQIVELPRWTEDQIGRLVQSRTMSAGIEPRFDRLVVPRSADEPAGGLRTENSYYRILWDHSGGNPAVALQAWRESLFDDGAEKGPVVRLFREPSAREVEKLPLPLLFVLRAVVQLELASESEIASCTQLPSADVADAIRFSLTRRYVERVGDRVRLAWPWYRTITTVLIRQHLLVA